MKLVAAADHAGFRLKDQLVAHLRQGWPDVQVEDLGVHGDQPVDYPDLALQAARGVAEGRWEQALLVCGSGAGMAIAANKVAGVRAAVCTEEFTARVCRRHNDANALCLGERVTGVELARAIVDAWMESKFEGGRHARRLQKISEAEQVSR